MSTILPPGAVARVEFFENHNPTWAANAVAIGTTAAAVTALTTKTTAARAAYNAQQLAQEQAKAATQTFRDAVTAMVGAGTDIIKQVKAKAATDGNSIYTLALLPVPATPTPIPAPGTPFDFAIELQPDGSLKLKWKCANPAGCPAVVFGVTRTPTIQTCPKVKSSGPDGLTRSATHEPTSHRAHSEIITNENHFP